MAGEWIETTVGEQATLQRGIDITRADQRAGMVPVISSGGVSSYHDTAAVSGPGVILGRKGVVGSVYYIPSDYWPHDTTLWVKDFHGNDQRFVYYFFRWLAPRIATMDVGSANPTLNRNHVHPIEVHWPQWVDEQRAIAHILGTLDDKIELNRRMSETLEAVAQALFKSWFMGSTQDGLPRGWKEGTVGEDFQITMGQSPPGETYNEIGEGLPFFQGRADFSFRFPALRVYCNAPTRRASPGDTLVCVRAPVGDVNMATQECCIGRGLAAARHRTGSRSYTYYAMHALREDFDCFEAEGTVFGSMNKKDFHAIRHIVPSEEKVKDFEALVSPLDQLIENNESESRTLATLRDTLLPKLLSGEIRVKKLEGLEAELKGGD